MNDEKIIADLIASNRKLILSAINNLENLAISLAAQLDGGVSRELVTSRRIHRELLLAFESIYMTSVEDGLEEFTALDTLVMADYSIKEYQKVTSNTLLALIDNERNFHKSLADSTVTKLQAATIDHVISGTEKDSLANAYRQILTASGDKTSYGRAMSSYADTIAHDAVLTYYRTAHDSVLVKRDDDKFKYFGSLIKTSRPWCRDHVGKTYTRAEIREFDSQSWSGKKGGATLISAGGWMCRHSFIRIIE